MSKLRMPPKNTRGVTLVELLISAGLIALISLSFMLGVAYNVRAIESNRRVMEALQVAQYYEGLLFGSNFTQLGQPNLDEEAWEHRFSVNQTYTVDDGRTNPHHYNISFRHTGWGDIAAAGSNSLTASIPQNQDEWITNEWVGQYVVITRGRGEGQIMRILSNTNNTLNVTQDVSGNSSIPWAITPDNTSRFFINNGKTVHMTVTWEGMRPGMAFHRTVLLPRPGGRLLN
ncbi:MAG: type II secretion system protein [Candidatus Sumerlaeia bacterium]|nr:type II secretion system protein [Candidatus Sumerlaeia bacterium]